MAKNPIITVDYYMHPDGRILQRLTKQVGSVSFVQGDKVVADNLEAFRQDKRYSNVTVTGAPSVDAMESAVRAMDPADLRAMLERLGHAETAEELEVEALIAAEEAEEEGAAEFTFDE